MKKILIVDDESNIRQTYRELLESKGFSVEEAANADQGNEVIKKGNIDLVLLDIKMAEVGGNTLFEIIKGFHPQTKVIVTSVYPLDEQKRLIAGASDYFDKSQGLKLLIKKVRTVLNVSD